MPWFVGLLLLLSLVIRTPLLHISPPELFGDEVDVGYQSYSLLKTGRDLYGQPFPFYIHSLSEWRAPLTMYFTVPSMALLGNTTEAVRLPQAVLGSVGVIIVILLSYQITKSKPISLLSGLAMAIMPWHIHYSRAAFEVILLLDLIMLGATLFLRRNYFFSAIFLGLSFYTYSTATLFVPLLLVFLIILKRSKPSIVSTGVFFLVLAPFIYNLFSGTASARFSILSIFSSPKAQEDITSIRSQSELSSEPIFHNRPEWIAQTFLTNYLKAFSTEFLFTRGDPVVRHSWQLVGGMLSTTFPIFVLGLFYLGYRKYWVPLIWLTLSPIPSALTLDGGLHGTRLILMIPALAIASGAGFYYLWSIIKNKSLRLSVVSLISLIITGHFLWAGHYYLVHYPKSSWRWWHVGYEQAFKNLSEVASGYDQVFINNTYEPSLIRFLFYTNYPPEKFHQTFSLDQSRKDIYPGYDGFKLDKYYFGTFSESSRKVGIERSLKPGNLYILSQRDEIAGDWDWRYSPPEGVKVINASANYLNQPLFYLVTAEQ